MRKFSKRSIVIAAVTAAALASGGIAYASWVVTGQGRASVQAANVHDLKVSDVTLKGELIPAGTADLKFNLANPNSFAVLVTSITIDYSNLTVDTQHLDCVKANIVNRNVNLKESFVLAADHSETVVMNRAIELSKAAPKTCAGASFTIPVTVTGESTPQAPTTVDRDGMVHLDATYSEPAE